MLLQNGFAAAFAILSRSIVIKYKNAHFQVLAIVFACLYGVGLLYVVSSGGSVAWETFSSYALRYVIGGILFGIWAYLSYRVFQYVDAAIASLLSLLNIVAVVVTASSLISEGLSIQELIGAAILLLAMAVILSAHTDKRTKNNWFMGILLTLLASSVYGLAITNEKWLIDRVQIPTYIVYGFGFQLLPLLLMSLLIGRSSYKYLRKADFRNKTILAGIVRGAAGLLFVISFVKTNNVSLISVLSGFKVVLATIFGVIFLHETKLLRRKYIASLLATIGVAVMLWK